MKLSLKAHYTINGTPKGSRNPREIDFYEVIDFVIPEYTDLEAPVATRWRNPDTLEWEETRWINGDHYRLVMQEEYGADEKIFLPLKADILLKKNHRYDESGVFGGYVSSNAASIPFDSIAIKDGDMTPRNKMLEYFQSFDNAVVVENHVWIKSSEPVYQIFMNDLLRIKHLHEIHSRAYGTSPSHAYRADRFADALSDAGEPNTAINAENEIAVIIPESITFDDERYALIATFEDILDKIKQKSVSDVLDDFDSISKSHHILKSLKSEWNEERAQALIESFQSMAPRTTGYKTRTIDHIAHRWRNRPIDLDLSLDGGRPSP